MSCLEKNLEQIAKYNKPLADKIANHEIQNQERYLLDYTKCDDLNLFIDGIPLHDPIDPVGQAKEIYDKNAVKENVTILFGFGLGYLFERFVKEQKERILVYEPNLDILRIAFGVFDFSEHLASPKIRIVNDKFYLKSAIETIKTKDDSITLYFLPYCHVHQRAEVDSLIQDVAQINSLIDVGYKELANKSGAWALSTINNFYSIAKNEELEALSDKFAGKPAVIISAGPSLLQSIDYIKKYRDKIVVIAVGISLRTLAKHGIKPDFAAIIEIGDCRFNLEGVDTEGIRFIFPPEVNDQIYEANISQAFNYYTENLFTSDWVQGYSGVDCSKYMNRGTVSITSLWSAKILGCNPLILVGQDLAYSGGKLYSGETMYGLSYNVNQENGEIEFIPEPFDDNKKEVYKKIHGIEIEEDYHRIMDTIIKVRKKDLTTVMSQDGELVPTSCGYALFVKHFEEIIPLLEGKTLINSSKGGAQIDGYENMDIADALAKYATEKIDVDKVVNDAIKSYRKPTSIEQKIKFIDNTIEVLHYYCDCCEKGVQLTRKFNQQYKRARRITDDLRHIMNKGLDIYVEIIKGLFSKNRFVMSLSYRGYLELEESIKLIGKTKKDSDFIAAEQKLFEFFDNGKKYAQRAIKILIEQREKISESFTAKS
jgi:hypothetical protein